MPLDNKITFTGALGDELAARLDMPPATSPGTPSGRPRAFALFAHCFTCSKDIFAAQRVSAGLAERGILVRDVSAYPGLEGSFRIGVGSGGALRATRSALEEILR